jgi:hypothetical protein
MNVATELKRLIPPPRMVTGSVTAVHGDGTVSVEQPGGAVIRVKSSIGATVGTRVAVRNGVVENTLPNLSSSTIGAG